MQPGREIEAGSRWHEWIIIASIAALACIGVASIWGGSIRRWIDSPGEPPLPASAPASGGASGSRL
jgi:hypothetical protein